MTADNRIVQLGVSVDTTEAEQGFAKIGAGSRNMAQQVSQAGQQAAVGIDAIGTAAEGPAGKVDRATSRIVASIQRATAAAESAGKSGSAFYESLASQRGANLDVLKPYLAQLDAVTQKQMDAKIAMAQGTVGLNEMGISAKATAAAMRGVPAQFTDIITSLQGGQQPMTVLLQQGGQLKDMFGGIGNASKALGSYVVGLINPFTLLAAGVGAVGYAYYKGSQETDAYNKALILSGNIAGTTSGQMSAMAANIAKTTGTQMAAAAALAEMAQSSGVGRDNLESFTRAAIKFESATGAAVSETVKQFNELAKSPLDASLKLNDTYNYLTASVYRQIKALDEQGKTTEAANLAQKAFADTLDTRSAQMIGNLGYIEQGWNAIKKAVLGAGSAIAGIGRDASPADQAATLRKQLEDRQQNGPTNELARGSWEKGNEALKTQLSYLQEQERQLRKGADLRAAEATQVKALAEWDKTGVKFLSDKVKMEQDINAAKNLGIAAGESQAKIEARIKDIRESYAKKGGAKSKEGDPFAADREYAKEYAKAWEDFTKIGADAAGKTDDLSKAQARLVDYLKSPAYANHNAAMRETVLQSAYGAIASEQLAAEKKKEAAAMKESADAAFANSEAIYKSMVATEEKLRAQLQENETMGMTAVQIAQLVKARDLEAAAALDTKAALYEQAGARDEDIDGIKRTADALRKLADARLDSAVKKQEQADWMSFFTSIDNAAHQVWSNVLQGGQDIWSKLKNTAKTIFFDWLYQMTLKKWIFNIGATITGSGTMAQTAASAGGGNLFQTGSNLYSAYNNGSSLYGIGSAYASGTMSGANAAGSIYANATGTGIDGLLVTNGAYGTAAGSTAAGTAAGAEAGTAGAAGAGAEAGAAGVGAGAVVGLAAMAYFAYMDWKDNSHQTIRNGGGYKADKNGNIVLDQGTAIGPSTAKPIYDQEGMLTGSYAPDGNLFGGRLLDANGSDVLATKSAASLAYGNTLLSRFGSKATFDNFSGGAASSNVNEGIAYAGATVNGKKLGVSDATDKQAQRGSMTDAQTVDEYMRLLEVLNIGGLQAAKLAGPMGDYLNKLGDVSTMTKKAADATLVMINTYADFKDTFKNSPFDNLKTASVEASAQLVKVAGDIGALAGVTANYYDLFATDAEKQAHALGLAKDAFSAIGVTMPELDGKTRDWYKTLISSLGSQDLSIEKNAKAYTAALSLAGAVNDLAPAMQTAAEATAEATAEAIKATEQARTDAISAAKTAFDKSISAQRAQYQTIVDVAAEGVGTLTDLFALLKSNAADLYSQVESTSAASASAAQQFIAQALATASSTGYLPDNAALSDAISTARAGIEGTQYSTQFEADRARLILAGQLDELKAKAGGQLSIAEQQLSAAKDQLTYLDKVSQDMQTLIDASNGISTGILSVVDAVNALQAVLKPPTGQTGGKSSVASGSLSVSTGPGGGSSVNASGKKGDGSGNFYLETYDTSGHYSQQVTDSAAIDRYATIQTNLSGMLAAGESLSQIASTAQQYGVTQNDIATALGYNYLDVVNAFSDSGIPRFDIGTNYVPRDMLAMIHEGEAVVPRAYNPAAGGQANGNTEGLITAITRLEDRLAKIETATTASSDANAKVVDVLTGRGYAPIKTQPA